MNSLLFSVNLFFFNRQTRSYYPEQRLFGSEDYERGFFAGQYGDKTSRCANENGYLDLRYIKENFGAPETNSVEQINKNQEIAYKAITNVLENFVYINVYEHLDISTALFSVITQIWHPSFEMGTGNYSVFDSEHETNSELNERRSKYYKSLLENKTIFEKKFKVKHKRSNLRERRNVHSTYGKRPKTFKVALLKEIYRKNQQDMIVWMYFRKKFNVSLQYYSSF